MPGTETCCGFGGLFSVKFPDISNAMVDGQGRRTVEAAGAGAAAVGRARLPAECCRKTVAARIADRLPACRRGARRRDGRAAALRSRHRGARHEAGGRDFEAGVAAALANPRCRRRSPTFPPASSPDARGSKRRCPSSRRCAARAATSAITRWRTSISTSKRSSATRSAPARACIGQRPPPTPATSFLASAARPARAIVTKSKSMVSEEVGLRARLEERRAGCGRDRSWRVHHPDPRRDAEPHHCPGHPLARRRRRRRFPPAPWPPRRRARSVGARGAGRGSARCAAREVPQSPRWASPAPTSSSPRPARPSSSPTRATPT